MQRHHREKILCVIGPVEIRYERYLLEELTEMWCLCFRFIGNRLIDHLFDVLKPGLCLYLTIRLQLCRIACVITDGFDQRPDAVISSLFNI